MKQIVVRRVLDSKPFAWDYLLATMATSPPALPGETTRLTARSVLVIAPHYDDEVLGCGGLLIQLIAAGARVRVLFLSDGSGGDEVVQGRDDYARRRSAEAHEVAGLFGFESIDELGVRDGSLGAHRDVIAAGIRRALDAYRPDLLLVPSPTEITTDHQAAFLGLCDVLCRVRNGDELFDLASALVVLLYEANQPAHPDLLVDVSAEMAALEAAIAPYASQLELHNYLEGAVGLRRYRTLSLPKQVRAAEGYRRLSLNDFVTRSPRQLVDHLGGSPAPSPTLRPLDGEPRVSVVVRTFDRPELLYEALTSLAASDYRNLEVVLVNDGGTPPVVPAQYPLRVVRVDLERNEGRAAAANAGLAAATGDYVAFLDDDDLIAPEHFETLVGAVAAAGVRVVYSDAAAGLYELSPQGWRCRERRLPYSRNYDADFLLLDNYIPFNTILIERSLAVEVGGFDTGLPFFEDWDFLIRLSNLCGFHHLGQVTCEYRHFGGSGDQIFGSAPRNRPDFLATKARVLAKHANLLTPEHLARAIDRLRLEAVQAGEENRRISQEHQQASEQNRRISRELEQVPKLYGEIERLNQVIATLQNHPVMRLYRRLRGVP